MITVAPNTRSETVKENAPGYGPQVDPTFTRAFTQADRVIFRISGNVALATNDKSKSFHINIGVFHPFACSCIRFSDGRHRAGYLGLSEVRPLSFESYIGVGKRQ